MNQRSLMAAFIIFLLLIPGLGRAAARIFEVSDSHSAYDRLPDFIRSLEKLRGDFLAQHPDGQPILIVNGDFGGGSRWASERGWIGMEALGLLATKFTILYVPGNHDGFDFKNGNKLMREQLGFMAGKGIHILAANYQFDPLTAKIQKPYFDVTTDNGEKLRFVGLGLENLVKKSAKDPKAKVKLVENIEPTIPVLIRAADLAIQDQVTSLVLIQHDGHVEFAETLLEFQAERRSELETAGVKTPLAFAAHDHLRFAEPVGSTFLVDSGEDFDFSYVDLDDVGRVVGRPKFFDRAEQNKLATQLVDEDPNLSKLVNAVEKRVAQQIEDSNKVLGRSGGFNQTKADLKKGRAELGTAIAEPLREWGFERLGSLRPGGQLKTVAFYNSSSYRPGRPIPPGDHTAGLFESFYPLLGEANLFVAKGSEIQNLYSALRRWRVAEDGAFTPQISANLREIDGSTSYQLKIDGSDFDSNEQYGLVLDAWLSADGYEIPEFRDFLKSHRSLADENMTKIFKLFGPKVFAARSPIRSCSELFLGH